MINYKDNPIGYIAEDDAAKSSILLDNFAAETLLQVTTLEEDGTYDHKIHLFITYQDGLIRLEYIRRLDLSGVGTNKRKFWYKVISVN